MNPQIDSIQAYKEGSLYEIFMHRAFRTTDRTKPGMHSSAMVNLINSENGSTIMAKYIGSTEKQLIQVKKYMHKAMEKYLRMKKIPPENIRLLNELNESIDNAYSSTQFMKIINQTLELTRSVIN